MYTMKIILFDFLLICAIAEIFATWSPTHTNSTATTLRTPTETTKPKDEGTHNILKSRNKYNFTVKNLHDLPLEEILFGNLPSDAYKKSKISVHHLKMTNNRDIQELSNKENLMKMLRMNREPQTKNTAPLYNWPKPVNNIQRTNLANKGLIVLQQKAKGSVFGRTKDNAHRSHQIARTNIKTSVPLYPNKKMIRHRPLRISQPQAYIIEPKNDKGFTALRNNLNYLLSKLMGQSNQTNPKSGNRRSGGGPAFQQFDKFAQVVFDQVDDDENSNAKNIPIYKKIMQQSKVYLDQFKKLLENVVNKYFKNTPNLSEESIQVHNDHERQHRLKRQTQAGYTQDPETCKKYNDNLAKMWATLSKYLNYTDSVNEIALHNIAVMVEAYLDHKSKAAHDHPIDVSRDERKKDKISEYLRKIKKMLGTDDAPDKVKDIILEHFKPEYEEDDPDCKQINEDNLVSSIAISYQNYLENAKCHGDYDTGLLRGKALLRSGTPTKTDIKQSSHFHDLDDHVHKSILDENESSEDFHASRTPITKRSKKRNRMPRSVRRRSARHNRKVKLRGGASKSKSIARKKSRGRKRTHVRSDESCVKYANRKFLITLRTSIERFMDLRDCQHDDTLRMSNHHIESNEDEEDNDANRKSKYSGTNLRSQNIDNNLRSEYIDTLRSENTGTTPRPEIIDTTLEPQNTETTPTSDNTETTPTSENTDTTPKSENIDMALRSENNGTTIEPENINTTPSTENNDTTPKTENNDTNLRTENVETTSNPEQIDTNDSSDDIDTILKSENNITNFRIGNVDTDLSSEANDTKLRSENLTISSEVDNITASHIQENTDDTDEYVEATKVPIARMKNEGDYNGRHFYSDAELGPGEQNQINNYLSKVKDFEDPSMTNPIFVVHSNTYKKPILLKIKNKQDLIGTSPPLVQFPTMPTSFENTMNPQPLYNQNIDSVYKSFLDSLNEEPNSKYLYSNNDRQEYIEPTPTVKEDGDLNNNNIMRQGDEDENTDIIPTPTVSAPIMRQNLGLDQTPDGVNVNFGDVGKILNDVRNISLQTKQLDTNSFAPKNEKGYVELSYLVKYPKSIIYRPHYLVKNILQYDDFVKVANEIYVTDDDKQLLKIVRYLPDNSSQTLFETQDISSPLEIHDVYDSDESPVTEIVPKLAEVPHLRQKETNENKDDPEVANRTETKDESQSASRAGPTTEVPDLDTSVIPTENSSVSNKQEDDNTDKTAGPIKTNETKDSIDPKEVQRSNNNTDFNENLTVYTFGDNDTIDDRILEILNSSLNSGEFINSKEELDAVVKNITSHHIDDSSIADYLRARLENEDINLSETSHAYLKELEAQGISTSTLTKATLKTWWEAWKNKLNNKLLQSLGGTMSTMLKKPDINSTLLKIPDLNSTMFKIPDQNSTIFKIPGQNSTMFKMPDQNSTIFKMPDQNSTIFKMPDQSSMFTDFLDGLSVVPTNRAESASAEVEEPRIGESSEE